MYYTDLREVYGSLRAWLTDEAWILVDTTSSGKPEQPPQMLLDTHLFIVNAASPQARAGSRKWTKEYGRYVVTWVMKPTPLKELIAG